jgi:acyl transferase domain-containing protein
MLNRKLKQVYRTVDFKAGRLQVVRCNTPWPESLNYRRASVNSFGYGGANAHVILDAVGSYLNGYRVKFRTLHASERLPTSQNVVPNEMAPHDEIQGLRHRPKQSSTHKHKHMSKEYLFVFSAHDHSTLLRNIAAVSEAARPCDAFDLSYTLATKRSRFRYGAFGISNDSEVPEQIQENKMTFGIRASSEPVLAFAFTGNGIVIPHICEQKYIS